MDISGLSNYTDYLSGSSNATSKMNSINSQDYENASDEELMGACKQFESYLVEMVMDEVAKTVDIFGTGDDTSSATSTTQDLVKDQLVQSMASKVTESTDLGIAQKLYESMKRNYDL